MASWASIGQAHAHWADSASLPDATLQTLLDVATTRCEQYAPDLLTEQVTADLTSGSAAAVGPTGTFRSWDVGATLTGTGVPSGPPGPPATTITAVTAEGDTATMSRAATVTTLAAALTITRTLPTVWMLACVYDAREVYAAGQRDGDIIGLGDYAIRARPLTSTVKSLLRPEARPPAVG